MQNKKNNGTRGVEIIKDGKSGHIEMSSSACEDFMYEIMRFDKLKNLKLFLSEPGRMVNGCHGELNEIWFGGEVSEKFFHKKLTEMMWLVDENKEEFSSVLLTKVGKKILKESGEITRKKY